MHHLTKILRFTEVYFFKNKIITSIINLYLPQIEFSVLIFDMIQIKLSPQKLSKVKVQKKNIYIYEDAAGK